MVSDAGIRILDAGFLSTVQDRPRQGLARYGLSESGPMAPLSYAAANWLAGNAEALPAIEVTMKPPRILFLEDARVGLGGADFGWRVDGRTIPLHQSLEVRKGSTLQGDYCRDGLRGYIAFSGGLACTRWKGSAATHVQSGLGGQRLSKGAQLQLRPVEGRPQSRRLMEALHTPLLSGSYKVLRIVECADNPVFAPEAISLLGGAVYRISEHSSRMATRLEGLALPAPKQAILSAGAWHGAIQVPPSGIPQILAAEHPATGGYPILASVIRADWELLGQLRPREEFRFGKVSIETAIQLLRRQHEWMESLTGR